MKYPSRNSLLAVLASAVLIVTPSIQAQGDQDALPDLEVCSTDVLPLDKNAHRAGGEQEGFQCRKDSCSGAIRDGISGEPIEVSVRRCDLGEQCLRTEARMPSGDHVLVLLHQTPLGDQVLYQQSVRIEGPTLEQSLYSVELVGDAGTNRSRSFSIDGVLATDTDFVAAAEQIGQLLPGIRHVYAAGRGLGVGLGFEKADTDAVASDFLSCIKPCIVNCGGGHNNGTCQNFQWWDNGSWGTYFCVASCVAGCTVLNPVTAVGCSICRIF